MAPPDTLGILERMALETTIKVSRELRDRVNAAAKEQRMTASAFLEVLVGEYERDRWFAAAVAEMHASPPEVIEEYMREVRSMDGSLMDGLEDEPPYPEPDFGAVEWFPGHEPPAQGDAP
jgi:predicted transcriptional regulator